MNYKPGVDCSVSMPEVALAICSQYHLSTIETHLKATYKHIYHSPKQKIKDKTCDSIYKIREHINIIIYQRTKNKR